MGEGTRGSGRNEQRTIEEEEEEEAADGEAINQDDIIIMTEGELKGGESRMEVLRISRGTGLGNPFPLGKTGHDKTEGVRQMSEETHKRWLEAGSINAEDMVTAQREDGSGGGAASGRSTSERDG